jgi:hypothetical protein
MYFACLVAAVGVTIWFLLETPKLKISNEYGVL